MRIKDLLFICLVSTSIASAGEDLATAEGFPSVYENEWARMDFPEKPLGAEAIEISLRKNPSPGHIEKEYFHGLWKTRYFAEKHFAERGIQHSLCYSKFKVSQLPSWQLVPYPSLPDFFNNGLFRKIYSLWKQTAVLYRTVFPGTKLSEKKIESLMTQWSNSDPNIAYEPVKQTGTGALTRKDVLEKQLIFPSSLEDDSEVLLLYNYAPLRTGGKQMHFMLIPRPSSPAKNFLELRENQYVEILSLAQKIANWAEGQFPEGTTLHIFDKTGEIAGQSQPIYHAHVVIIEDDSEEMWGKLSVFFRMLLPRSPLANKILERRVSYYRESLGTYLIEQISNEMKEIE